MIFCNLCGSFVAVQGERNQLHARDIVACARHEKDEENVLTDTEIIDLYLERDQKAVQHTAEKYGMRLRRIAEGITRDAGAAEECENDTYLKTWEAIPPNEPRDYFFVFLARITRHLSLDVCKERNRLKRKADLSEFTKELEECIAGSDDTAKEVEGKLLGEIISKWLRAQSEEQRNIFLRRYWYMDSVEEIAQRFGYSESKVKSVLFRSRNSLRDYLRKEGYAA